MIFMSRKLFDGYQPGSTWDRQALRTWKKLQVVCEQYEKIIEPLLPKRAIQLNQEGLHDAIITGCRQRGQELVMTLDATHALSRWSGQQVTLRFSGVTNRTKTSGLVGQWWLYSELHLPPTAKFSLHVLLTDDEIQINADDVAIEVDH